MMRKLKPRIELTQEQADAERLMAKQHGIRLPRVRNAYVPFACWRCGVAMRTCTCTLAEVLR